jgi:hypothetical protein
MVLDLKSYTGCQSLLKTKGITEQGPMMSMVFGANTVHGVWRQHCPWCPQRLLRVLKNFVDKLCRALGAVLRKQSDPAMLCSTIAAIGGTCAGCPSCGCHICCSLFIMLCAVVKLGNVVRANIFVLINSDHAYCAQW